MCYRMTPFMSFALLFVAIAVVMEIRLQFGPENFRFPRAVNDTTSNTTQVLKNQRKELQEELERLKEEKAVSDPKISGLETELRLLKSSMSSFVNGTELEAKLLLVNHLKQTISEQGNRIDDLKKQLAEELDGIDYPSLLARMAKLEQETSKSRELTTIKSSVNSMKTEIEKIAAEMRGCDIYGYMVYNSKKCIRITERAYTWQECERQCGAKGHLACITDDEMNSFVANFANDGEYLWIGFHDATRDRRYTWTECSKPNSYTKWATGEPNGHRGTEFCAEVSRYKTWNDANCDFSRRCVCEMARTDTAN